MHVRLASSLNISFNPAKCFLKIHPLLTETGACFLCQVDPYLSIGDDSQVYVKPQADEREYGSVDEEAAVSSLAGLRTIVGETDKDLEGIIVQNLCAMTEVNHLNWKTQRYTG